MTPITKRPETERLEQVLLALGVRIRRQHIYRGLIQLAYTGLAGLFVFFLIDWLTDMPYAIRLLIWVAALGYGAFWFIRKPLHASQQPLDAQKIGLLVEKRFPELHSRMISTLQLQEAGELNEAMSADLVEGLLDQTFEQLPKIKMDLLIDVAWLRRGAKYLGVSLILIVAAAAVGRAYFSAFIQRLIIPNVEYPTKTKIVKVDAPKLVPLETPFSIRVHAGGRIPRVGHVKVKTRDGFDSSIELTLDEGSTDHFTANMPPLLENATYTVYLGDAHYGPIDITPMPRPTIKTLTIDVEAPAYTGEPAKQLHSGSGRAIRGSTLTFTVVPTQTLRTLKLTSPNKAELPEMKRQTDGSWKGTMAATESVVYSLAMISEQGLGNGKLPRYRISVTPDRAPQIRVKEPALASELAPVSKMPLVFEVRDDFRVNEIKILYDVLAGNEAGEILENGEERQGSLFKQIPAGRKKIEFNGLWDNGVLQPQPGQQIRIWIEARDNRAVEPQITRSQDLIVTIVTPDEYRDMLIQRLQDTVDPVENVILDIRSSKRQLEKIDKK